MPKICIAMAFICFTLLVLPNSSNSRYLLVELDGSPDMDPGMDDATEVPEMPESEDEPTDDLETEPLPEDDEEDVMAEPRSAAMAAGHKAIGGGYRSKPASKDKKGIAAKPGAKGKGKPKPPITNPAKCNEGKKCITNAGKKDPSQGAGGRWWNACLNYPVCVHPYYNACYYTWGPHTYCMYG